MDLERTCFQIGIYGQGHLKGSNFGFFCFFWRLRRGVQALDRIRLGATQRNVYGGMFHSRTKQKRTWDSPFAQSNSSY